MFSQVFKLSQFGVAVFWLVAVLSAVKVIPAPFATTILWVAAFILMFHLSEYLYARFMFDGLTAERVSFVWTILFGLTHLLPLVNERLEQLVTERPDRPGPGAEEGKR